MVLLDAVEVHSCVDTVGVDSLVEQYTTVDEYLNSRTF